MKPLLIVDGQRIVDRQIEALRRCFEHLLIVTDDPTLTALAGALGIRAVPDRFPGGAGPLAGLDAALAALPAAADAVVCVAGDMPFLAHATLELVRDRAPRAVALVPRVAGQPQPLLARYARACAGVVREQLARGELAMKALLARLPVTWVDDADLRAADVDLRSFFNVNTPGDLRGA